MCGISACVGTNWEQRQLEAMIASLRHRGPDHHDLYVNPARTVGLGHNRLSIIDLSPAGHQPMADVSGRLWLVFNGEIYNYLELRAELSDYPYHSQTDSEVVLAAYERWGEACLDHFIGMFAFILWDEENHKIFAARDRFGVKPLFYHQKPDGTLILASEIKALHAAGVEVRPDTVAWATYLASGLYDHSAHTFWEDVKALQPGHCLTWQSGKLTIRHWYDLSDKVAETDARPLSIVMDEYLSLLKQSITFRFRSDVPVGINLSGGLDSSILLGLVGAIQGPESDVKAFTFVTGDPAYDELPWVQKMLAQTHHPSIVCLLKAEEVPELAHSVQYYEDEPFAGLPTLAYARLFEQARAEGVIVLLDGNGMDEQWAGYDYYQSALRGKPAGLVQGTKERTVIAESLTPDFRARAEPFDPPQVLADPVRNLQVRDLAYTKIPRATRFNDRISMRVSTELREPFLDHRLIELALCQPVDRKLRGETRKWLLRQIASRLIPSGVVEAPKRPLQTPQREWLRGPLASWATDCVESGLDKFGGTWLEPEMVRACWQSYRAGQGDNSFFVWQWISLGLLAEKMKTGKAVHP
jgi:asparagine synthase (glutamine-hydrolysing)